MKSFNEQKIHLQYDKYHFNEYRIGGPIDISELDSKEIIQLKNNFVKNFDLFTELDQSEFLEQLLLHNQLNDQELFELTEFLNQEQKSHLAEFIAQVLVPTKYLSTFYHCWDFLPLSKQITFIDRFSTDEPEYIAAIIPFIDATKVKFFVSKEYRGVSMPDKSNIIIPEGKLASSPATEQYKNILSKITPETELNENEKEELSRYYYRVKKSKPLWLKDVVENLASAEIIPYSEISNVKNFKYNMSAQVEIGGYSRIKEEYDDYRSELVATLFTRSYHRAVPVLDAIVQQESFTETQIEHLHSFVSSFFVSTPEFIYPYLADLYRLKIISKQTYYSFSLDGDKNISQKSFSFHTFETDDDKESLRKIEDEASQINFRQSEKYLIKDPVHETIYNSLEFSRRAALVSGNSKKRALESILQDFYVNHYQKTPELWDELENWTITIEQQMIPLQIVQTTPALLEEVKVFVQHIKSVWYKNEKVDLANFFDAVLEQAIYLITEIITKLKEQVSEKEVIKELNKVENQLKNQRFSIKNSTRINEILHEFTQITSESLNEGIAINLPETQIPKNSFKRDKIQFIKNCIDNDWSVFYIAEEFELTSKEVKVLLYHCDEYNFAFEMEDLADMKKLISLGFGDEVIEYIGVMMKRMHPEHIFFYRLLHNLEEILSMLSEQNQSVLLDDIKRHIPHFLFFKMDFSIEQKLLDPMQVISRMQDNTDVLLSVYLPALNFYKKNGASEQEINNFKLDFKHILLNSIQYQPEVLLYNVQRLGDFLSEEEYLQKVEEVTNKNINPHFYTIFLKKYQELSLTCRKEILSSLLNDTNNLLEVLKYEYTSWLLETIIGRKKIIELIFKYLDELNIEEILERDRFIEEVIASEEYTQNIIDFVKQKPQLSRRVGQLFFSYSELFRNSDSYYKPWSEERLTINNTERERLNDTCKELVTIYENVCEENPRFAVQSHENFQHTSKVREIFNAYIKEYLLLFPEQIKNEKLEQYIPKGVISELIHNYPRVFAFGYESLIVDLYQNQNLNLLGFQARDHQFKKFYDLNPEIEQSIKDRSNRYSSPQYNQVYYNRYFERLQSNPYYPLYQKQLERISSEHIEKMEKRSLTQRSADPQFQGIYEEIQRAAFSPITRKYITEIMYLPQEEQKVICRLIAQTAQMGIDETFELDFSLGGNDVIYQIEGVITLHIAKMFNISVEDDIDFELIPNGMFKPLQIFYNRHFDDENMQEAIRAFIKQIIYGHFEEHKFWSQQIEDKEDQKQAFHRLIQNHLIPEKISFSQYEAWVDNINSELEELFEYDFKDIHRGIHEIEAQALADQHITSEVLVTDMSTLNSQYEELTLPGEEFKIEIKNLENEYPDLKKSKRHLKKSNIPVHIIKEYQELKQKARSFVRENLSELNLIKALMYYNKLKRISLDDLKNGGININNQFVTFESMFGDSTGKKVGLFEKVFKSKHPEFYNDILRIKQLVYDTQAQLFGDGTVSRKALFVTDTHDLEIYFRIGEKPVPSCQHYDSEYGSYDKGLLSYEMDPTIKIIQLFDDRGEIIARGIIRLLEDQYGDPALFLERVYSTNMHPKITDAIVNAAKIKAENMEVKVYSREVLNQASRNDGMRSLNSADLYSKQSKTPYTYTDAGGGLMNNGIFTIYKAYQI